jgi:hypothetical protein
MWVRRVLAGLIASASLVRSRSTVARQKAFQLPRFFLGAGCLAKGLAGSLAEEKIAGAAARCRQPS